MVQAEVREEAELLSSSSSESFGAYRSKQPRLAGEEKSPLPADTPSGGRKKKLGDPASF